MTNKLRTKVLTTCFAATLSVNAFASNQATNDFNNMLDVHWKHANEEQIFFRKDPDTFRMNGKLPDMSKEGRARRAAFNQKLLNELDNIDVTKLSADDQVTYRLFKYERQAEKKSYQQLDHRFPMNYYAGYHSYFAGAPANMSFLTKESYDNYLISLADFKRYNSEHITDLTNAISDGQVQYCASFANYHKSIGKHLVSDVKQSVFYAPFESMPTKFSNAQKAHYIAKGTELITEQVLPEYKRLYKFFTEEYMANCRKVAGVGSVTGGEDYYQYLIEFYTTTSMNADEIHELGLQEMTRIKKDMHLIMKQVGFEGTLKEFIKYLREEPKFYTDTKLDLLEKVSYITRKVAAQLPKWFSVLPRATFDVKSSPSGGAYYVASDGSGTTSGTYFIGTDNLKAQPLYTLEALTFHEGEPGHHFQGSIAQEVDMAEFRKTLYHSAYGEGWGLYAERLGKEMGFYQDPYSDFGRLTYEAWRACRLVVDTGIHAKGWTRQQAIDYLADNTALSMPQVIGQIDRYISWPAQALSYKVGEIQIRNLRKLAETKLGDKFDIRKFHDQMLTNGSLPMALLEELTNDWIDAQL